MKDNVCPIGVLEEENEWNHSEVTHEGVVAEHILGEIADKQMQREKDLTVDLKKRLLIKELLASAKTKARDVGVVASKCQLDFYTQLTYS